MVRISALRGAGWSLLPLGLAGASLLPRWRCEPAPFCLAFEGSLEDECPDPNCVKLHSPGKIRNDVSSSKESEHRPGILWQKPGEGSTNGTAQKSSRRLWCFFHVSVFRLRALKWFEGFFVFVFVFLNCEQAQRNPRLQQNVVLSLGEIEGQT